MTEFDLRQGLRQLSDAPRIDATIDEANVARRVRRGRAVRASGVTAASVAVVVGVGTAVWAVAPFDDPPVPPAQTSEPAPPPEESSPAPSPTPDPQSSPAPPTTEEPDEPSPPELPPIVAVTTTGELVLLDPADGTVQRTVTTGFGSVNDVEVDRQAGVAYVTHLHPPEPGAAPEYRTTRVSLADGSTEVVEVDGDLEIAGTGLWAGAADRSREGRESYGVVITDPATGSERYLEVSEGTGGGHFGVDLDWSPDGSTLAVLGYAWSYAGPTEPTFLRLLPAGATSLEDGRTLTVPEGRGEDDTGWTAWILPAYLADGRLAVVEQRVTKHWWDDMDAYFDDPMIWLEQNALVLLEPETGAVTARAPLPRFDIWAMESAPDGDGLLLVVIDEHAESQGDAAVMSLHRLSPAGSLTPVVTGYAAYAW